MLVGPARERRVLAPELAGDQRVLESVAFIVAAGAGLTSRVRPCPTWRATAARDAVEELERCAEAIDAIASRIEDALKVRTEPEDEATA